MGRDRLDRPPGRETRPAYTRRRQSWYGYGTIANMEKSRFGCFLHDVTSIFGEVSILGLPALMYVATTDAGGDYGVIAAALVAWMTLVLAGALVRGGSIRPLATATLGWITFSPALILLRVVYYNVVLLVAAHGSVLIATAIDVPPLSLVAAAAIAVLAALALPRLGEELARSRRP